MHFHIGMEFYVDLELVCHVLWRLSIEHWDRFQQSGHQEELNSSLFHRRIALRLCPEGHPDRCIILSRLPLIIFTQFKRCGRIEDLEESITLLYTALDICPDNHPDIPTTWTDGTLDEAIGQLRAVLEHLPDSHPDHYLSLCNLANSLKARFERYGRTADLDEAIKHFRTLLGLRPNHQHLRSTALNDLAVSLQTRYIHYGRAADLDASIDHFRASLDLCRDSPLSTFFSLNNLATCLRSRFEQYGQSIDLDYAIEYHRTSLELLPEGHLHHSLSLCNLATSLRIRFRQHRQTDDLDESIKLSRAALRQQSDDNPERLIPLISLARSLQCQSEQHEQTAGLDEIIDNLRAALKLVPDSHPKRPTCLSCLATSLLSRFKQQRQDADLDESIEHHRAALELYVDGHVMRSQSLSDLALSLFCRFETFGSMDNLEECIQLLKCATEYEFSSLIQRLHIARQWTTVAQSHAHHSTARAYQVAMFLLQRVLVIRPTLHAQRDFLEEEKNYRTLTLNAAAYAIEGNRLEEAVEILEQGRGLLWSQMRGFRTSLDDLAETNRELADRFRNVSHQLESLVTSPTELQLDSSIAGSSSSVSMHREQILFEEKRKLKMRLSKQQEGLINEIRRLPGFENFLTATPFRVLRRAASEGPVIVINHCKYRSDAFIVLYREDVAVVCVPLDREFYQDIMKLCLEFCITRVHSGVSSPEYDTILCRIMKTLWDRVVSKVVKKLEELGIPKGSRIWWCPTSVLSALPFHAAGPFEDADGAAKYLLDDYVSSYTPTLGALINARSRENTRKPTMLIVGDTITLKSTEAEIRAIHKKTQSYVPSHTALLNERASRKRVLKRLQKATWIHFACHGHLGRGSLDSSFRLSDGGLTLLDIIRANLPNAELAFLSACHTAEQYPCYSYDEVLQLAAAVQFSGFRSVIGTMWEMYDPDGPLLASEVYSYMGKYEDGEVIYKRSAAALRKAVLKLRVEDDVLTERWVNLVHIGA
ncbi:uncharacterized protein FOMMEDRAFT_161236 [Fomitiporia mediterranea MF3/22]|uniref:uncharacterized protein n=1 Tax=Fomitiporia mediterranea (strain MF3/22) TaxID=694068 RepID=UPI0004407F56|nr:uncharacterized protein FOMMEDRAFT_161236 [Fomitiporia mediterranea MF3/22]EJC99025.1 hypothetical protein FOMMEDRAFT_161236 [Fomitiporia mediterranea MF3/22]